MGIALKRAAFDATVAIITRQVLAFGSPVIGAMVGVAFGSVALGATAVIIVLVIAPVPGWLFIVIGRKGFVAHFASKKDLLKLAVSFVCMFLPTAGNFAAFPVSLLMQDNKEYLTKLRVDCNKSGYLESLPFGRRVINKLLLRVL